MPLPYDHFGNWYEPVADRSWDDYAAARPGALRQTIRRRLRRAERDPSIAVDVIDGPTGLEAGITAYEEVYARSWKKPEPFPGSILHCCVPRLPSGHYGWACCGSMDDRLRCSTGQ